MMSGATLLLSGAVILIAALMVFAVIYVLFNWIGRYKGVDYSSVKSGFMVMTYVLMTYIFWHVLFVLKIPVSPFLFVIFYLILFLMVTYYIYKKYKAPLLKSSLWAILAVLTLFLAELLHSYFMAKLLVVMGRVF